MSRSCKPLSIDLKVDVLNFINNGGSKVEASKQFGLRKSTIISIWRNRAKTYAKWDKADEEKPLNELKKPGHAEIDCSLVIWIKKELENNLIPTRLKIRQKAMQIAKTLGISDFTCSPGWLEKFKKRHNLNLTRTFDGPLDAWLKKQWPRIKEGYDDDDIFNGVETGLFFRLTPIETHVLKTEKCLGGKFAKDRYTLFVCANMSATEKLDLIVIGRSDQPRMFPNLPVKYFNNRTALMSRSIFESFVREWDAELVKKNRKILLLVDNSRPHLEIKDLKAIKLVYAPPSATTTPQPMDQGVVKYLKYQYRKKLTLTLLEKAEDNEELDFSNLSNMETLNILRKSWNAVTPAVIRNSFTQAGFNDHYTKEMSEKGQVGETLHDNLFQQPIIKSYVEFVEDPEILVCVTHSSDMFIEVYDDHVESDELDEDEKPMLADLPPTVKKSIANVRELITFYQNEDSCNKMFLQNLYAIEQDLERQFWNYS